MAFAVGLAVVVAVVAFAPDILKSRFQTDSSTDVALRSDIWNGAVEIYSSQPVLGVGLNNFQTAYERLPSTSANSSQRRLLHNEQLLVPPHAQNNYLRRSPSRDWWGCSQCWACWRAASLRHFGHRALRSRGPGHSDSDSGLACWA